MAKKMERRGAVLITGASTGIGQATALHLDKLGYQVFAGVRNPADGEAVRERAELLKPVILDVTDPKSIAAAKKELEEVLDEKGLAGLINNAGVSLGGGPIELSDASQMRQMFDVNVFGAVSTVGAFAPLLRQARGRIVNVGSIAALATLPFHGGYSASKVALRAITDALRLELRSEGIQVAYAVCGCVKTPIWGKGSEYWSELLESEEMARYRKGAAAFMAYMEKIADAGISPEQAAKEIARTMTDRRLRKTYYIGPDARSGRFTTKLLKGPGGDGMLLRAIGMEAKKS